MKTYHIHIQGIVQGVGFRPYIYKLCTDLNLSGWVSNTSNGVHIQVNSNSITDFIEKIRTTAPEKAKITKISYNEIDFKKFKDFTIVQSNNKTQKNLLLTPDYSTCTACEIELISHKNRRHNYPFITCTNCGPRFSITKELPYDRITTTMRSFTMCSDCKKEYENPLDRRYYSQTNSCPNCKVKMQLYENEQLLNSDFSNLNFIIEQWDNGKIIAIKGIGGYLLTCDATNEKVIKRLRKLKNRPTKPFALMYHDIYELSEDVELGIGEKLELEDVASPIVLLSVKKNRMTPLALDDIAPKLNLLGVMLPYTPLYKLLLSKFKKPIVATSGNISNSTIIYKDDNIKELSKISDFILTNNREITVPQDDSIIRYSSIKSYRTIVRRSRGYAPSYMNPDLFLPNKTILAMGAMLKSTFTLLHQKNIHISQYLGNTDTLETEENYKNTLSHFNSLFQPEIEVILIDKHPNYFTTIFGKELATKKNIKTIEVQHHKAHFFAVLAENNLLRTEEKILGVIWDGTGYGNDKNIWGGEFFTYDKGKIERVHHLDYFPFILGDKMSKEPRISALVMTSFLKKNNIIKKKFTNTEWNIYQKKIQKTKLKCSSIGRLFDAAASIILNIDKQTYEGEAAMQLESAAYRYFRANNFTTHYTYFKTDELPNNFVQFIMENIVLDIEKGFQKEFIAAKFHITLAHYIYIITIKKQIKKVVFSGGVFQNMWLVELILSFMSNNFELYFHKNVSPNDENISFGQLMYYLYAKE